MKRDLNSRLAIVGRQTKTFQRQIELVRQILVVVFPFAI